MYFLSAVILLGIAILILTSRGSLEISHEYNCLDFACVSCCSSLDCFVNSKAEFFPPCPDNVAVNDESKVHSQKTVTGMY